MPESELRWFGKVLSPDFQEIRAIVLSDLHLGNPYSSLNSFARTIKFIQDNDNCFCWLNGDLLEAVTKQSKGDIYTQQLTPQQQRDDVLDLLMPIKDKILGMTTGNHEQRIYNETGVDLSADIANSLSVPYRPEGMLFKLSFGEGNDFHKDKPFVFWCYITHGFGGARTKGAKAVKVERVGAWLPRCDFIAMSHDHVVNVAPDVDFIPDNRGTIDKETGFLSGAISAHRKILIKTNAFLKWGGYSESLGFPPSDLATPLIYLVTPLSPFWRDNPNKPRQAIKVVV